MLSLKSGLKFPVKATNMNLALLNVNYTVSVQSLFTNTNQITTFGGKMATYER